MTQEAKQQDDILVVSCHIESSITFSTQHFPQKTKYELTDVFLDLLNLAASALVVGGRLAYWFPVFPDE